MKLLCIFPTVGNEQNIPHILHELNNGILEDLTKLGAKPDIVFTSNWYTYVPNKKSAEGYSKGKGIIESLKNAPTTPDYVICCDGSNAIPYKYVAQIFQELTSDSSVWCAMANRKKQKAITPIRYLIERFEIFILSKYHNNKEDIPDGQCGLWGFRMEETKKNDGQINLTAGGYAIELDLLSEVLQKNLPFVFSDIKLPPRKTKSSFSYENNLKKMKFLFKKHDKLSDSILKYFNKFEKTAEFNKLTKGINRDGINKWGAYKEDIISLDENNYN